MIGKGLAKDDLYLLQYQPTHSLDSKDLFSISVVSSSFTNNTLDSWHKRLGLPSFSRMKLLPKFASLVSNNASEHCVLCTLTKHKRLPFHSSEHHSFVPFELVHCDI